MNAIEIFTGNLEHFQVVKRYNDKVQALCPCHNDKNASLTITKGNKCTLFHCHAGCKLDDILFAVGLDKKDTFYDDINQEKWQQFVESREKAKIENIYHYNYINGLYAFTKIRLNGKKMLYGILKDDRFLYGIPGGKRGKLAIYGDIKALQEAKAKNMPIYIPEGEKDVNTLISKGYTAFTYGGCGDWQSDFKNLVIGANVIILRDNDDAGLKVAKQIFEDLVDVCKSVKIINPMPDVPKADITDYFKMGHSNKDFEALCESGVKEERVDLTPFHILNASGQAVGVFDNAIFEHIKANYDIFIYGSIPYIYGNGYFKSDETGANLKTIIRGYILPQFIKSTTIQRIYNLFLQDIELIASFEDLNNYPSHWICFRNGMYDAINSKLLPHSPKYKAINQIPHIFEKQKSSSGKNIEKYLDFICEDKSDREMLLQYIGYCLVKDTTQQKFLVLTGVGGSGKSTLIKLIERIVGVANISNISLTDLQQRFACIGLMGKLLNSCADLEISALEETSLIKKILGEDALRGESKGKDAISFKSYAKLMFSTNELPLVKSEKTNGFYRRLLVLTMNKIPLTKNPNLFEELENEIDYLLQISVEALERMYKNKLITVSKGSEIAVSQLWKDSDTVEAFLSEMCERCEESKIERGVLYKVYESYCEENERQALTRNNFYKSLRIKGYKDSRTSAGRFFNDIKTVISSSDYGFKTVISDKQEAIPF